MKFRKKPVVIEAWQLTRENSEDLMRMVGGRPWFWEPVGVCAPGMPVLVGIIVPTLAGQHRAKLGDWIIRGVKGEVYPIKDNIFRETYEAV